METHESTRSRSKRDGEDNADARNSKNEDSEDWDGTDRRKHRASKSRKYDDAEEVKEQESGRRKVSGDRNDDRKKAGGLSRAGSGDEEDYDMKREPWSKIPRKNMDERAEKRSSDGYQDRDLDSSRKRRDDGYEWESSRRTSSKASGSETSQNKPRSKVETSYDVGIERSQDRESRYPERKDSTKERKDRGQYEDERKTQHRRSDETETCRKVEESSYIDRSESRNERASDHNKHGPGTDREPDFRNELCHSKSRVMDPNGEKGSRISSREERREDCEKSRSRAKLEVQDDDNKMINAPRETRSETVRDDRQRRFSDRSPGSVEDMEQNAHRHSYKPYGEKGEKQKQQRDSANVSHDEVNNLERSVNMDEDARSQMWDRSGSDGKNARSNKRSRTPERTGRAHKELDETDRALSDSDNERAFSNKDKEREKESYRDDRSLKGKDSAWTDKVGDWEGSRDQWKRSQVRQESKDGDGVSNMKEWDTQRREHGRMGSENIYSRPGYRKDNRMRSEGARGSLNFGNRNESSDSIEIRPNKNLDFGREESVTAFPGRKTEDGSRRDFVSGAIEEEWGFPPDDRSKTGYTYVDDSQEGYLDNGSPMEQNSGRNSLDSQSGKGRTQRGAMNSSHQGTGSSGNFQSPFGSNQGSFSFNRNYQQGPKGGRPARGGRGRLTGREASRVGLPPPMMAPAFGHLGLPPGPMQPVGPNLAHSPAPPMGPGVFIPPFPGPIVWPGPRGIDMNMLSVPPNLPHIPPGSTGPRFPPNIGTGPSNSIYFNQPSPGRGAMPNIPAPGFNAIGPIGRETPQDKSPIGWTPQRTSGPAGKAPSRGEQNDYSQNFVDTGMRPQNFIRELELTSIVEDYPKLRELIQRKDEIVSDSATTPMYYKCDLHEHVLSPEFFGTKFDVILVDPPWEEYVHRAPGITDHLEYWTVEEIMNLKIEAIADTPSFIFLWVGDGMGLEQGRQCLKKWGFRRCEDICWVKTNKKNAAPSLRHDSHTLFQHSKEHCLMGIKGTVRRSTDGHIIHANIDTDIIIAEEPSDGSTKKPEDMYRIIEHFALGRRRLELFGEDHNIRPGWLTAGKGLSSSNFNAQAYVKNFADKDGKVWQGGGGRNPPPDAPHLVVTTPEIEALRPKSPPAKNQQPQSTPLLPTGGSNNRRATGNSPQNNMNSSLSALNMDPTISEPATPAHWASSPMVGGFRGPDGVVGPDAFEVYGFNASCAPPATGDHMDFDSHRTANLL